MAKGKWGLYAGGIALLALFPVAVGNPYYIHLAETILIYAILLFGLDIVVGYTGEVSLGHAALFGIGSYTAGIFFFKLGVPYVMVMVTASIAITAMFGAILALPALRVTGPYLAMVTLAFGTIVQILINEMTFLTNGPLGIPLKRPQVFDWRHWLPLALRDSPIACDCMGVSVYRHKVLAFMLSAGFAGLAGVLFAYSELYIAPNNFSFELSIQFLLAVTMGGRKSRVGPILGAAIVVFLPNLLADIHLFRDIAGAIAAVAIVAGGIRMVRQPEERARTAIPV